MPTKKAKPKAKTCECAEAVNVALEKHNTRLVRPFVLNLEGKPRKVETHLAVAVEKIEPRKRALKTVLAAYCPFCGRKL